MMLIREFETRVNSLFEDNGLPGFVHLCIGQEAVAVGGCSAIEQKDYITSAHRGHGHFIAKGLDPNKMMAELLSPMNLFYRMGPRRILLNESSRKRSTILRPPLK